jgi:hypothetical protein
MAATTISEPVIGANSNDGLFDGTRATPAGKTMPPTIYSQPWTLIERR